MKESVAEFVRETDVASKRAFTAALANAQRKGEIASDKNPEALATYLYSAIQGFQVRAKAGDNQEALEAIADLTLSVLS